MAYSKFYAIVHLWNKTSFYKVGNSIADLIEELDEEFTNWKYFDLHSMATGKFLKTYEEWKENTYRL